MYECKRAVMKLISVCWVTRSLALKEAGFDFMLANLHRVKPLVEAQQTILKFRARAFVVGGG